MLSPWKILFFSNRLAIIITQTKSNIFLNLVNCYGKLWEMALDTNQLHEV